MEILHLNLSWLPISYGRAFDGALVVCSLSISRVFVLSKSCATMAFPGHRIRKLSDKNILKTGKEQQTTYVKTEKLFKNFLHVLC